MIEKVKGREEKNLRGSERVSKISGRDIADLPLPYINNSRIQAPSRPFSHTHPKLKLYLHSLIVLGVSLCDLVHVVMSQIGRESAGMLFDGWQCLNQIVGSSLVTTLYKHIFFYSV